MHRYPLVLKPAIKDYLWGGTRLKSEFGYEAEGIAAEAWTLSCHKDGPSLVTNGDLAGKTLTDALELWGSAALGKNAASFPYFPLLIKLIDARDRLSVQVHPNDEYAQRVEGEFGKTEMWYVVDCEPGAQLIYGFTQPLSKEEFRQRTQENTLLEVCHFVPVQKGDVFFIEAGTLHAIGAGIVIAEVQQNSNTTYRVSDYGRIGADGKPRPLHIDKAVDVTVTTPPCHPYGATGQIHALNGGHMRVLADCEFFSVRLLTVEQTVTVGLSDSFCSLLCLENHCTLIGADGQSTALSKGVSVFLPAGYKAKIAGSPQAPAQLLYSFIP